MDMNIKILPPTLQIKNNNLGAFKFYQAYDLTFQTTIGTRQLRNLEEEREQRRLARKREDMERRMLDAEYLIGSAITDAVETKREISRSRSPSPRSRSTSRSPVRSPRSRSKSSAGLSSVSPQRREPRPSPQRVGRMPERRPAKPLSAMNQTFTATPPPKVLHSCFYIFVLYTWK